MEPRTPDNISDYCAPTRRPNAWFVPSMVGRRRTAMSLATTVNTVGIANTERWGTGCQGSSHARKPEELLRRWIRSGEGAGPRARDSVIAIGLALHSPLTKSALDASGLV